MVRGRAVLPAADADQAGRAYEAGHPLAAEPGPLVGQFGVDPRFPGGAQQARVDRFDLGAQGRVRLGPRRRRPGAPRLVLLGHLA